MRYRPEIDGLRALAVIPVILFHADFAAFSGGYIGVDVFFVISGYLITGLILSELADGRFSLAKFYERRARRILPALMFVVLACVPFAWAWMLPDEFRNFFQSVVATATFWSNILFWSETGYFAQPSATKPLLHTWSLAIEEQFYIVFPVLLLALWKWERAQIVMALAVLAALSLSLAVWLTNVLPAAAFFLLPTRAWELLLGALCAFYLLSRKQEIAGPVNGILAVAGLLLVLVPIHFYNQSTPYPGAAALAPTLGTAALILFAQPGSFTHRFLSARPLPQIGLISYSAYLWHHPSFAFMRIRSLNELSSLHYAIAILVTFLLAYLTWRFIEQPFRDRKTPLPFLDGTRRVLVVAATSIALVACLGLVILATDARSTKVLGWDLGPLTLAELERQLAPNRGMSDLCNGAASLVAPECRTSDAPKIAVWGDSFAMHLVDAVVAANPSAGVLQLTQSVCVPVLGMSGFSRNGPHNARWARGCVEFNDAVMEMIAGTASIEVVVISSPFDILLNDAEVLLRDGTVSDNADGKLKRAFEETLRLLSATGKHVVVVSPTPQNGQSLGSCVARRLLFNESLEPCRFPISNISRKTSDATGYLASLPEPVVTLQLAELICQEGACTPYVPGGLLYRDNGHLSHFGSRHLGTATSGAFRFTGDNPR